MNHIYRSIWSATLGCWVAAPETASAAASRGRVRSALKGRVAAPQAFLTTVAAAIALWLGSALPAVGQSINVAVGETKNTSVDFPLPGYFGMVIDGTLNHNSSSALGANGVSNVFGTLNISNLSSLQNFGTLTNAGTLKNVGMLNNELGGTLANTGTLDNGDTLVNAGALTNAGTLTNEMGVSLANSGTLTNQSGGTLKNQLFANLINELGGELTNEGTLTNEVGGELTNEGTLTNSGMLNNYGTLTNTGTLINNGTVNHSGALGGTLSGIGTFVGNIDATGVLAAGNTSTPYGTLRVNGNLTMVPGSTLQVRADPDSTSASKVVVNGNATLAGTVVHVGNESNAATDFQVGTTYTILTATSINGRFQSAKSNYAYLNATLGYLDGAQIVTDAALNATDVTLTLDRKAGLSFADLANTPNQGSTANAIESLPSTHALYQHVVTLPAGTPAAVFSSLSGDAHSTVLGSVNMLSSLVPSVILQHLHSNLAAGLRAGAPIAQSGGPLPASAYPSSKALPAWVEVVGNWQKLDGNSNAPGVKQNTTGLFLGADEEVGRSGWRVGGSVGYTNADAKVSSRDASADISSYSAAVYAGKGFSHGSNRINVIGGLAYTKHSVESERSVATLNQNLKADYSAHTAQLFAEVGYAMGQYDKQGFEPFVGITLGEQRSNSFKESGGFAALSSESSRDTLASTTLGVHAHSDFVLAGKDTRVRGTLGVRHAWGNLSQNRTMAFESSSSFTVAGAPLARNTALVGLQAEMALSRYSALVLGYKGEYASGSRDQSASVKVRWAY